jgi:phosphocarrier protein
LRNYSTQKLPIKVLHNSQKTLTTYTTNEEVSKIESKTYIIKDEAGLHARPASIICSRASKYPGDIDIIYKEQRFTLKSIMILMSLGVPQGAEITIEANGEGELDIINDLDTILNEHNLV